MVTTTKKVSSLCHSTVRTKVEEILASTPGKNVTHIWSWGNAPDHNNGRSIDFMIRNIKDGQAVFDFIWARRVRYGVRLIIWNGQIVRTYDKPGIKAGTAVKYTGNNPHRDHPHVEFNSSPLNKAVSAPAPKPKPASNKYVIDANGGLYARSGTGKNIAVRPKGFELTIVKFVIPKWSREKFGVTTNGTYYAARYLKRK